MSPTTAFHSLSVAPPSSRNSSALDDIFGEPSPPRTTTPSQLLDDVFGHSSPSATALVSGVGAVSAELTAEHVSDIPRLRSIHVTAGYRDGIAQSKAEHVQDGFDEGYPLGAMLGLKAGRIVGVLEGVVAAALRGAKAPKSGAAAPTTAQGSAKTYDAARRLLQEAREELDVSSLFGPHYFDQEGIWRYHVDGREEDVTFEDVAAQHPSIAKWTTVMNDLAADLRLDLHVLDRRGRGEVDDEGQAALLS